MLRRLQKLVNNYLLSKTVPPEGRLFNLTLIVCLVGALFGAVSTALQASSFISVASTVILVLLLFILLIICNWKRIYRLGSFIVVVVTCFMVFPFIFFSAGGLSSGMTAYLILGVVMIAVLLDGIPHICALVLYIIICVVCYTLGYYFPDMVTP
ncbi:MAG: hypothetical protein LBL27_04930, partial [Coriobacteriales bacterium]|nr:hypothetical protein [Coriobacteriales bacterium]